MPSNHNDADVGDFSLWRQAIIGEMWKQKAAPLHSITVSCVDVEDLSFRARTHFRVAFYDKTFFSIKIRFASTSHSHNLKLRSHNDPPIDNVDVAQIDDFTLSTAL